MSQALLLDLYELTMAVSYLRRGMTGQATFSLFVRDLPPERGFLVAAGLGSCLDFLQSFGFDDGDLEFVRQTLGLDAEDVERLRKLRFTGDVWAVPEGSVVFANEPLLEVTSSLPEGQLVETFLLNQIGFQTAVASKAARCHIAAAGRSLVDFSFRRTQGIDAGFAVARSAFMAGFDATSNVEASRRFGIPASGTMAHSYVQAFPTETAAFSAFAHDFPDRCTFLVDTYDTLAGVRKAIDVMRERNGGQDWAIRLDSGDLVALSKAAREMLNHAGFSEVGILASGGLDEFAVEDLVKASAPINGFGVGTRMGVSADAPYLDVAYKLVEFQGNPVLKLSPGKESLPGRKQVFRTRAPLDDVIGLRDEPVPPSSEPLLGHVMSGGRRIGPREPLRAARERCMSDLALLAEPARRIQNPGLMEA